MTLYVQSAQFPGRRLQGRFNLHHQTQTYRYGRPYLHHRSLTGFHDTAMQPSVRVQCKSTVGYRTTVLTEWQSRFDNEVKRSQERISAWIRRIGCLPSKRYWTPPRSGCGALRRQELDQVPDWGIWVILAIGVLVIFSVISHIVGALLRPVLKLVQVVAFLAVAAAAGLYILRSLGYVNFGLG